MTGEQVRMWLREGLGLLIAAVFLLTFLTFVVRALFWSPMKARQERGPAPAATPVPPEPWRGAVVGLVAGASFLPGLELVASGRPDWMDVLFPLTWALGTIIYSQRRRLTAGRVMLLLAIVAASLGGAYFAVNSGPPWDRFVGRAMLVLAVVALIFYPAGVVPLGWRAVTGVAGLCLVVWAFAGNTAAVYVIALFAVPLSVRGLVRSLAASQPSGWTRALKRAVIGPDT